MAHSFDISTFSAQATTNPKVLNHTCGTGATLLVIGIYSLTTARAYAYPSYSGVLMTPIAPVAFFDYGDGAVELWYLSNPSTGTQYTINVPNASLNKVSIIASSYKAAAGYTSIYDASSYLNLTSGYSASTNIAATADGVIVSNYGMEVSSVPTIFTDQRIAREDAGSSVWAMQYKLISSTATYKPAARSTSSDEWLVINGAFKQLAAVPFVPNLNTPTNNATNVSIGTSTLTWSAANAGPVPASYVVQVCKDETFVVNDVSVAGVTTTYYESVPSLAYTTEYWWRVKATDATGDSAFTGNFKFTTEAEPTSTLIKSINNVANGSVMSINNVARASALSVGGVV